MNVDFADNFFFPGAATIVTNSTHVTYKGHIYMVLGVFTIIIDLFNKTF